MEKKINVSCLLSMIFSLVGLVAFGIPCGIAAVIIGIIGIAEFNHETQKGKGMGIAGIAVGAVDFFLVLMFLL